jgi:hypothetical protein
MRSSTPLTPNQHSGGNNSERGPTSSGYYYLAEDGADVEPSQGWNHGLKDLCANDAAYCSGNRVAGS